MKLLRNGVYISTEKSDRRIVNSLYLMCIDLIILFIFEFLI